MDNRLLTQNQSREIHIVWKVYKASGFSKKLLTDRQILLLKLHYGV